MRYSCKNCQYIFEEIPLVHNHPSVIGRWGIACLACRKIATVAKVCPRCQSFAIVPATSSSLTEEEKSK